MRCLKCLKVFKSCKAKSKELQTCGQCRTGKKHAGGRYNTDKRFK